MVMPFVPKGYSEFLDWVEVALVEHRGLFLMSYPSFGQSVGFSEVFTDKDASDLISEIHSLTDLVEEVRLGYEEEEGISAAKHEKSKVPTALNAISPIEYFNTLSVSAGCLCICIQCFPGKLFEDEPFCKLHTYLREFATYVSGLRDMVRDSIKDAETNNRSKRLAQKIMEKIEDNEAKWGGPEPIYVGGDCGGPDVLD